MRSGGKGGGGFRWRRAINVDYAAILFLREHQSMGILVGHDDERKMEEEEEDEEKGEEGEEGDEEDEMEKMNGERGISSL